MKTIYFIRHSAPFVEIENYENYKEVDWEEYNRNMILSSLGEKKAEELTNIVELKDIKNIYASNSVRAISTAKYLAERNETKIKLDNRLNERILGINKIKDLPDKFEELSFKDKTLKLEKGESLLEVDNRLDSFINDLEEDKVILVIHGIMLLSYLSRYTDFTFENNEIYAKYKDKLIINKKPKNPDVIKVVLNGQNIEDIEVLN